MLVSVPVGTRGVVSQVVSIASKKSGHFVVSVDKSAAAVERPGWHY